MEFDAIIQKYKIVIEYMDDHTFVANAPELRGCEVKATTRNEAIARLEEAMKNALALIKARGEPLPTPFADKNFSGNILVRVDPRIHRDISLKAAMNGVSLNRFIETLLENK